MKPMRWLIVILLVITFHPLAEARFYDPKTGRYITSDPIGLEGGLNTYQYANANPGRFIDPDGLRFTPSEFGGTFSDSDDFLFNPDLETAAKRRACMAQCSSLHPATVATGIGATPIPKRAIGVLVMRGASPVTNPISGIGMKVAPNLKIGRPILGTNRVFGLLGRLNLVSFAGFAAFDLTTTAQCVQVCMDDNACKVNQ